MTKRMTIHHRHTGGALPATRSGAGPAGGVLLALALLLAVAAPVPAQGQRPEVRVRDLGADGAEHYYRVYCPNGSGRLMARYTHGPRAGKVCAMDTGTPNPPCFGTAPGWEPEYTGRILCRQPR